MYNRLFWFVVAIAVFLVIYLGDTFVEFIQIFS